MLAVRETYRPKNPTEWLELRLQSINSTEAPVLFDESPYQTLYSLWHEKKACQALSHAGNFRTTVGQMLELPIAQMAHRQLKMENKHLSPTELKQQKDYMRWGQLGASFDFWLYELGTPMAILEAKNVDFKEAKQKFLWRGGEIIELTGYMEIQIQHQMLVANIPLAYVGLLLGGNSLHIVKRTPSKTIQDAIMEKVEAFWKSIKENRPPAIDFRRDATHIAKKQFETQGEDIFDESEEFDQLLAGHLEIDKARKEMDKAGKETRARILNKMASSRFAKSKNHLAKISVDRRGIKKLEVRKYEQRTS